jgi:hypothetical protein
MQGALSRGNGGVHVDSPHGFTSTAAASTGGLGSGFPDHPGFSSGMFHDSVPYPPPSVTPPPSAYGHMMASPSFVAHGDYGAMPWAGYSPMGPPSQYHSWQVAQADARVLPGTVPYHQGTNGGPPHPAAGSAHPQHPSPTGPFYIPQSPRYPPMKRGMPGPSPSLQVDGFSPKSDVSDAKRLRPPPALQPPSIHTSLPTHATTFATTVQGSSPLDAAVSVRTTPSATSI